MLLGAGAAARPEADASLEPRAEPLGEGGDEGASDVAEDEEQRREEHRRPRLPAGEVAVLHGQHLRAETLRRIDVGRDDLGPAARLARAPLARARKDFVDLEVVGVRERDGECRWIVGEVDHPIAVREVHGERGARAHVVEAQRDQVTLAPEEVLQPGGLLRPPEPGETHPEVDQERAVDEPRRPRDPDPGGRRGQAERPRLAAVGDERRAARERLRLRALRAGIHGAGGQRQAALAGDLEPTFLYGPAQGRVRFSRDHLAVHRARPQEIEILLERSAADVRRHLETPEQADFDRTAGRHHVRADRQRTDRELRLRFGREKNLSVRRRRDQRQQHGDEQDEQTARCPQTGAGCPQTGATSIYVRPPSVPTSLTAPATTSPRQHPRDNN